MDHQHIPDEIKRTAEANGGKPLGVAQGQRTADSGSPPAVMDLGVRIPNSGAPSGIMTLATLFASSSV